VRRGREEEREREGEGGRGCRCAYVLACVCACVREERMMIGEGAREIKEECVVRVMRESCA
jgi:hypothetical protein